MKRFLITGANRGLGLEMTRQLLQRGDEVLACCRNPEEALKLQALNPTTLLPLEVTDAASIAALVAELDRRDLRFDVLVNNAGIADTSETWGQIDPARMLQVLTVNTVAPVMVTQSLVSKLQGSSPYVVCITSGLGSLARAFDSGFGVSYPTSKTALNMAVRQMSFLLKPEGVGIVALCPGWTQTDMGGANAPLKPEESVRGQLAVIDGLTMDQSGQYWSHEGAQIPW